METPEFFSSFTEKRVLNGMLQNDESLEFAINALSMDDFYIQSHRYLFEIILRFYHKFFRIINQSILAKWLERNDPTHKSEVLILFDEILAVPTDEYLRYYIDELKTLTSKRNLYTVYKTIQTGLEDDTAPSKIFANITNEILQKDASIQITRKWVFDNPEERIKDYLDRRDHPEKYRGVPYGFKSMDELTGGMFPQQLYLITGRTNAGKSRFLFNIGCNAAKAGKRVVYCTIEMDYRIIQQMWESREAKIPLQNILKQKLTSDEEEKYFKFLREQEQVKHPFYIVDIPQGCTTGIIETEVNTYKKIYGISPDIVLVDYANLIQPVSKYKDRAEKYDHVFRELKEASRAQNTIYYTAAQLNRESTKAKKVGTEHVAFSDASSYHCDAVFHIYANDQDEINQEVHIDTIKGRYHRKGSISLSWARDTNHIRDWEDLVNKTNVNQNSGTTGSATEQQLDESAEY